MRRAAGCLLVAIALLAGCATPPVDVPSRLASEPVATSLAASVHALAERTTNHGRRRAIEGRADALGLGAHRRSEWIDWWSLQRNVVIELPGRDDGLVYVVAHYDKTDITLFKFVSLLLNGALDALFEPITLSEGAIDNATGVSLLLELAASMRDEPLRHTWRFLFAGSEESGLRGTRAHVARMSRADKDALVLAVNLDTVGIERSPNCVTDGLSDPNWSERVLEIAERVGEPLSAGAMPAGVSTDVVVFQQNSAVRDILRGVLFNLPGGLLPQRSWFTGSHRAPTLNFSACDLIGGWDLVAGTILLPVGRLHGPADRVGAVDLGRLYSLHRVLVGLVGELEPEGVIGGP